MSIDDINPLFLSDRESAALLGVGLTSFRNLVRGRRIGPPVKLGRRSLWSRIEIERFAFSLLESRNAKEEA